MFNTDYQKITENVGSFIQKTLKEAGFEKVVIGLSGGIDSAVVCALLVKAIGVTHVFPVILPYGELNPLGQSDAQLVSESLAIPKVNVSKINIKKTVDSIVLADPTTDSFRKGNIMARTRMIYLYDLAKKHNALVAGTENKTEYLLGYFTRFGDEASDFEILRNLYKTEVQELARYLNVPDTIIAKKPTAGLWEGQTDEDEFEFSYEEADKILHFAFDRQMKKEEIVAQGFEKQLVEIVLMRVFSNTFKHKTPYILSNK